jgi:glycosyltransferase involved in cell wall biosynthesis
MAGLFKRVPWVFELRDIWPKSIQVLGAIKQSKVLDVLEKVELFLYRQANVIVSVTHTFRSMLIRRGVASNKIHVVTNGVDISRFSARDKNADLVQKHGLQGKFVAGYIGTHGLSHALDTLLVAAKALKAAPDGDRFRIILLGDGASKAALRQRAENERLDNVIFVDSVSKEQVVRYWSLLDVSIIHLKKDELFTSVIPSKLFECMGMAVPVLHGVQGESAGIVEREDVGLLFEPENPEALINGLRRLADNPELLARYKTNGPLAAKRYDRSTLAAEMLQILKTVATACKLTR